MNIQKHGAVLTFLPLVEDRRTGMVDALVVLVFVRLAAAFMDALLCHCHYFSARSNMYTSESVGDMV